MAEGQGGGVNNDGISARMRDGVREPNVDDGVWYNAYCDAGSDIFFSTYGDGNMLLSLIMLLLVGLVVRDVRSVNRVVVFIWRMPDILIARLLML